MGKDEYGWIAWGYDTLIEPFNQSLRTLAYRFFKPEPGMAILDVGCGTGTQVAFYADKGFRPVGIDLSAAMLQKARSRLDTRSLVCRGDATSMPYRRQSFDWSLATFVLHEMAAETRSAVLQEMIDLLKNNGRLGIVDYHPDRLPTPKGWASRTVIRAIEFAAGRRHYRNYKHFMSHGGIPRLAERHGLMIERRKRVSGGNIGLYQLRRADKSSESAREKE